MWDHLSAEAREDVEERLAEEGSPRVFAIAAGLKEIKRARIFVEKGEVKEREFEKKGQWEHEVSQWPLTREDDGIKHQQKKKCLICTSLQIVAIPVPGACSCCPLFGNIEQ